MDHEYTKGEEEFVQGALTEVGKGELVKITSLKMSQNGEEVEFHATCMVTNGQNISIKGTYDGSWDEYICV